ncbi:MAG: outer membrane lipoprotein-sorting protein [Alphaproteobacteria bacterium]
MFARLGLAATIVVFAALPASAQTPEEKGLAIAEVVDRRDLGWGDSATTLDMILSNSQGETSTREMRLQSLEVNDMGLGDKSLTIFDRPRDVAGTAFLSHTKITEADDQWLYLPALKRVKRISSANKSGPFMGSEFAYEDLLSQEVQKYTYRWLRDEACGELQCFVIERFPVYENSGYTRQIVWIDTDEYRPMKVDFYDRKESLLKTLILSDYRQYLSKYWRAHKQVMANHQTGKGTILNFADYTFQAGVRENDFTPDRLKRVR